MSPYKRFVDESRPKYRTETQRDRDRILYSSEFQRLNGITQIASPEPGLALHNRLIHSLKVAQLARRLAEALKTKNPLRKKPIRSVDNLDVDAVEAAALAHDLGHPPFGHIAELELNHLASAWGGFEGNAQSFRIVTRLAAQQDLKVRGLNLTRVTHNAILKYPWFRDPSDSLRGRKWGVYESERERFEWAQKGLRTKGRRTLEAEIMDWADDVTYAVHDLQDFHILGLIPLGRLVGDESERQRFFASFSSPDGSLRAKFSADGLRDGLTSDGLRDALDFLFGTLLVGLLPPYDGSRIARQTLRNTTSVLIGRYVDTVEVRPRPESGQSLVRISPDAANEVAVLKELAWFYIINRPSLATVQHGQRRVVRELHDIYLEAARDEDLHKLFPTAQQEMLREASHDMRCVTDFVAGLTEEMAFELYGTLTGLRKASILDHRDA